jgi:HAD superfamily phosphatase
MRSNENRSPLHIDLLIFDMDGVLVDVSKSYRQAIQQTVQIYFETCLGLEKGRRNLITKEDISLFKSTGGFNNDWELTSALILYLLSISGVPPSARRKPFPTIGEAVQHLKTKSSPHHPRINRLIEKKKLPPFLERVKSCGGGLRGVRQALRKTRRASWDGWVYRSGDIDKENLVKRIFQELYLGSQFTSHYHLRPLFHTGRGYYLQERLLIPRKILTSLREKVRMGIASGRPRFEAFLALKRFQILSLFDSVVTLEECEEEERRILKRTGSHTKRTKPHPYSILRVARETGPALPRCAYIGDVVDDMQAARAAKKMFPVVAVGFLCGQRKKKASKEALFRAGADRVIETSEDLLRSIE